MMKLYRRWRSGRRTDEDTSLPTYDDFQPMETHEQEEMVQSFERQHAQQSALWRGVFSFLLLCFAVFLIFSIYQQALSPWELRYHAYFMDEISSWVVIVADSVAVLACIFAVNGLIQYTSSHYRQWIYYSLFTGILVAIFWLYHMLSAAGICLYVDNLLLESLVEVRKLRASMYAYKRT
ncbi:uncharacterized protein LOC116255482 isoform X2 [Nymphaea colorata]|uniref:uncharacterized protein LOC116255482 isoform X2 n=1 Tax=Nymphaea colorata TaxID=210225 RepID=UPI00129DB1E6|nr:uncharacterized protein LOC116255482 isoform X2 [Nymphaea colorata]